MRRLLPQPVTELDPYAAYGDVPQRWLRVGFVLSADGSVTDEQGWSDGLGGAADFEVFRTLRALADGIMVGAGTVRTGRLGPARLRADLRRRRAAAGKAAPAPIIVVSRSLRLDWTLPLFTAAETPTIVVTSAAGLADQTDESEHAGGTAGRGDGGDGPPDSVRVVVAGEREVDLPAAVGALREEYGLESLICEGGPVLTTSLLRAGLVDELCLNIAPTLIGGPHHTALLGELGGRIELGPPTVYESDGVLFLRYRLPHDARGDSKAGQPAASRRAV